jgi:putative transposase
MIEPTSKISVRRQCEILHLPRSTYYLETTAMSDEDRRLCAKLDALHLEFPAGGSRMLARVLRARGEVVNRKRIQRLMREMGLESLAPKPKTSQPAPEHRIFPYLLRHLEIMRPNQVWAADITYIPTAQGHCYLVAVMDWFSRRVLSWRLSNSMDPSFCVEAVQEATGKHGKPEIFNTDQGSQFTSDAFTAPLLKQGTKVSMDGRGRFMDNIFIERLWRSLKCEEVYLNDYLSPKEAAVGIGAYFIKYNKLRPHSALGGQTPTGFYESENAKWTSPRAPRPITAVAC